MYYLLFDENDLLSYIKKKNLKKTNVDESEEQFVPGGGRSSQSAHIYSGWTFYIL